MGLDACVYCDCVEKGKLKIPHPFPCLLYIAANGSPDIRSKDPVKLEKHNEWFERSPCKHSLGLCSCWLGSIGGIDSIREFVQEISEFPHKSYPVLWKRVIYCGSHTGDYLKIADVLRLRNEIKALRKIDLKKASLTGADLRYTKGFLTDLMRLINASLKVKKPIAF